MTAKIKLYAIAALLPLLALAVWQWRAEIRNAAQWAVGFDQLEQSLAEQQRRIEADRKARLAEDRLRVDLREELARIRQRQEQLAREFSDLERTDEEVSEWADRRLPGALVERLHIQPGANGGDADGN